MDLNTTLSNLTQIILMICIFVLNFDHIKGPSAVAKGKARAFFQRLKAKRIKAIL